MPSRSPVSGCSTSLRGRRALSRVSRPGRRAPSWVVLAAGGVVVALAGVPGRVGAQDTTRAPVGRDTTAPPPRDTTSRDTTARDTAQRRDTVAGQTGVTSTQAMPARGATRYYQQAAKACEGHIVSAIDVRPQPPYFAGLTGQWRWVARRLNSLHATTRPSVIRRFLALHVGQPCTAIRLEESERVLRGQPFIAEARVTAYDDGAGGVRIDVFTVDEIGLLAGMNMQGSSPYVTRVLFGEGNLAGQGIQAVVDWKYYEFYRDRYAANVIDYDFLDHPYRLQVNVLRDRVGGLWDVNLSHPFLTDLQRVGWVVAAGEQRIFYGFQNPTFPNNTDLPALDFRRGYWQLGGIVRVGAPGRLNLFGGSISGERESVGRRPVILSDSGLVHDTSAATASVLARRFERPTESNRINLLYGYRDIAFRRVAGFDALSGEQDLRIGVQVGTFFGRGLKVLGSREQDTFVSSALYTGYGGSHAFIGMQVQGEGREDDRNGTWDGILVSGRVGLYLKPTASHVFILSEEYGLGLKQRIPFQLTFADFRGGVRGYRLSQDAGGERSVTRLEEHWAFPPFRQLAQFGVAPFVDVGKLWAQDTPFGVTTPFTVGAGLGILIAVPPHSRRLWRLDIGFPLTHEPHVHGIEFRFTTENFAYTSYTFYREPRDISNAREPVVPGSIFNYP
jgi:hypothetical protein